MILSIFSGKEVFSAVILNGRKITGNIKNTDAAGIDGFISENRKAVNKAVILLSDCYNEYFINTFENAEEDDIEKAVAFKVKDLIVHPLNKSVTTSQTFKHTGNSLLSVSAISPLSVIKKTEDLMAKHGITKYIIAPASLFLLNLRAEADFVQLLTIDNITTSVFVAENHITYIRKTSATTGLNETFKFYGEKFNKHPIKKVFSIGRELENIYSIHTDNITVEKLLKVKNEVLTGLEAAIGAAVCV